MSDNCFFKKKDSRDKMMDSVWAKIEKEGFKNGILKEYFKSKW